MVIQLILYILVLATAVPAGLLLVWLCDDEIKVFRRYILMTLYSSVILSVLLSVLYFNPVMILSLVYAIIFLFVLVIKSYKIKKKK